MLSRLNIFKTKNIKNVRYRANFPPVLQAIEYDNQPSTNNLYLENNPPSVFKVPEKHKKSHNIPIANLQLKAYDNEHLDFFADFAQRAAYHLGIVLTGPAMLPTRHERFAVLKSPFVHKKSQEVFERRTHTRLLKVWDSDDQVVQLWIQYLNQHAMKGVRMKFEQIKYEKLAFGDKLPEIASDSQRHDPIKEAAKQVEQSIIENLNKDKN